MGGQAVLAGGGGAHLVADGVEAELEVRERMEAQRLGIGHATCNTQRATCTAAAYKMQHARLTLDTAVARCCASCGSLAIATARAHTVALVRRISCFQWRACAKDEATASVKWLCGSTSRSRRTFFSSISPSTTYVSAAASQRAAVSGGGFRCTADSIAAFELTPPRQPIMFIERSTSRTTVESPDSAKARASHPTWHRTQRTTFHTR